MGSPLACDMFDIILQRPLQMYCLGHAVVKGHDRINGPEGKATMTSGLSIERSEVFTSLRRDTACGHKAKDDRLSPVLWSCVKVEVAVLGFPS